MTDRQCVEAMFFLILFKSIVTSSEVETEGNAKCVAYLDAALWDVLRRHDERKRQALYRRAERVHNAAMDPDRKGGLRLDKAGMIGVYLLQSVLRCGYLELEEGSQVAVAIGAIMEEIASSFEEQRLDASARKAAAKMLAALQADGYFLGVEFEVAA